MSWFSKVLGMDKVIETTGSIIDQFVTDKDLANKLKASIELSQLELYKSYALHPSLFVAGARPAILWICAVGLGIHLIVNPIMVWIVQLATGNVVSPPVMDMTTLLALAGSGGIMGVARTIEKMYKVQDNH